MELGLTTGEKYHIFNFEKLTEESIFISIGNLYIGPSKVISVPTSSISYFKTLNKGGMIVCGLLGGSIGGIGGFFIWFAIADPPWFGKPISTSESLGLAISITSGTSIGFHYGTNLGGKLKSNNYDLSNITNEQKLLFINKDLNATD